MNNAIGFKKLFIILMIFTSNHNYAAVSAFQEDANYFSLDPTPHISIPGNYVNSNALIIRVHENCNGVMAAYLSSKYKKKIIEAEGEMVPVSFGAILKDRDVELFNELEVQAAFKPEKSSDTDPRAVTFFRIFDFENIKELLETEEDHIELYISTANTDLYSTPYESWAFNTLEGALNEAVEWCSTKTTEESPIKAPITMSVQL